MGSSAASGRCGESLQTDGCQGPGPHGSHHTGSLGLVTALSPPPGSPPLFFRADLRHQDVQWPGAHSRSTPTQHAHGLSKVRTCLGDIRRSLDRNRANTGNILLTREPPPCKRRGENTGAGPWRWGPLCLALSLLKPAQRQSPGPLAEPLLRDGTTCSYCPLPHTTPRGLGYPLTLTASQARPPGLCWVS